MRKKLFLLLALIASTTFSYAAIINGTCGDNLTWSLNTQDSTLTIEGSGEMNSWDSEKGIYAPWYEYSSYVAYLYLPKGLINIGDDAFHNCINITQAIIPEHVETIGRFAFFNCEKLITVEIHENVTSIGDGCFGYCGKLLSINIPKSVTNIGRAAFEKCSSLTSVTIPKDITIIEGYTFSECSSLDCIVIPDKVTSIQYDAFRGCGNMKSVTIGNSVTTIKSEAFYQCTNLTSVNIPNSVVSIEWNAFRLCGLTSVTLGSGIENIGSLAFMFCPIQELTIWATTPPTGGPDSEIYNTSCVLYVPEASVETYANTAWWEDFKEIKPIPNSEPQDPITDYAINYIDKDEVLINSEKVTLHFPEPPTFEGFTFVKWTAYSDDVKDGITIQAVYKADVPTYAPEVVINPSNPAQKLIRNGNVYILTGDKTYTLTGQEVK